MDKTTCLAILQELYKNNTFMHFCDIKVEDVACGESTVSMLIDADKHTNLNGVVHGGALEALADVAVGVACSSVGANVVTLNFTMSFIKNIPPGEKAICHGKVRHHGRTTIVVDFDMVNEAGKLLCNGLATMFVKSIREEIPAKW